MRCNNKNHVAEFLPVIWIFRSESDFHPFHILGQLGASEHRAMSMQYVYLLSLIKYNALFTDFIWFYSRSTIFCMFCILSIFILCRIPLKLFEIVNMIFFVVTIQTHMDLHIKRRLFNGIINNVTFDCN